MLLPNLVSRSAAIVIHTVRVINDRSMGMAYGEKKERTNSDTGSDIVAPCLCAAALPKILAEVVSLRRK